MKTPAPDSIDREHLEQTLSSAGWAAIEARIRSMEATEVNSLVEAADATLTATRRGFIQGIRACQRVPQILLDEMAEAEPAKKKGR